MKKRLIVVADNSLIVEAIRSGLHESGAFELLGYTDAYNASVRLISGAGADLVLLDEADQSDRAITLIRSIKEELKAVTIIVLAVRMGGEWLSRAFEAGASGAISKAVHPSALATLVREAISGHIVHPLSNVAGESTSEAEVVAERCMLTDRELQADAVHRAHHAGRSIEADVDVAQLEQRHGFRSSRPQSRRLGGRARAQ